MLPGVDGGAGIVGRMVCREFDSGSSVVGTIAYAHRPDGDVLLYRVVRAAPCYSVIDSHHGR